METSPQNSDSDLNMTQSQENSSYLSQNRIPNEMVVPYFTQNDFEIFTQDFQFMKFDQSMMAQMSPFYQYQIPYPGMFYDPTAPYTSEFPRAVDYSKEGLLAAFPHLEDLNNPEFDIEDIPSDAHFYILRSSNDDNVHKAIKYHKWTSTPLGKSVLKRAWLDFEESRAKPEIYFLFTVVNSNQFLGVAKMISNVNDEDSFKYWWEPCKWFGSFQIKWLFIKDIHYSYFEHISEEDQLASVVNLRDGTKISAESGKEILNVFKHHPDQPNIFDSFEYMDRREDFIRVQRDNDPEFQQMFEECCNTYLNSENDDYSQMKYYNYNFRGRKSSFNGNRRYNNNSMNNDYYSGYYQKNGQRYGRYEGKYQSNQGSPSDENHHDPSSDNSRQSRNENWNYRRRNYTGQRGERTAKGYFDAKKNYGSYKIYYEKGRENEDGEETEYREDRSGRDYRRSNYPNKYGRYRQGNDDFNQHMMG